MLSFVEGEPALPPLAVTETTSCPSSDACCGGCTTPRPGSSPPPDGASGTSAAARRRRGDGDVVCHNDIFPPNVIFRDGLPVALIDWDLAGPRRASTTSPRRPTSGLPLAHDERAPSVRALARTGHGRAAPPALRRATASSRPSAASCSTSSRIGTGWATRSTGVYGGERRLPGWRRCGTPAAATRSWSGAPGSRRTAPTCNDPSREPQTDHRRRHRLGRARAPLRSSAGCARTASASCASSAPTCPSAPSAGTSATRSTSSRPARIPSFAAAIRAIVETRGRRLRPAPVVVRSRGPRRASRHVPGAGARLQARRDLPLERQGRDVRVPAPARPAGAGVPAGQRRRRGRGRRARARLPRRPGLLQAGLLVGVARLPDPRPDRRPRAPAAERAARARSRCGSRRRSSCSRPRAAPICS